MFQRDDTTERFFVDGQPGDDGVVAGGFRWLAAYSREHAHTEGALVVPQLRSLDNVARVIGVAPVAEEARADPPRRLRRRRTAPFTESKSPWSYEGPILAVWTRDKSLEKLDTTGAAAICAAPWLPENIATWKENWNPVDVLSGNPGVPQRRSAIRL